MEGQVSAGAVGVRPSGAAIPDSCALPRVCAGH